MEGILPLWKPRGVTSHDCVFKVRKILRMKKVGHTGTLDPDVEGVLPICLGKATKIAEYITDSGKEYIGEVTIGRATSTEDASGEIVEAKKVDRTFSREEILDVLASLTGEIVQVPPMYSAVKVNGKRLYEYARKGIEVERPKRTVMIYELELLDDRGEFGGDPVVFSFRAKCGKGTYIRTLAVMIGERLGYPAHMSSLVRTSSGSFQEQDCITLEELAILAEENRVEMALRPLEAGLSGLPIYEINDKLIEKVRNGAVLEKTPNWPRGTATAMYKGKAVAIYEEHPEKPGLVKPVKVLRNEQ